jgi:hypothetical protein
MRFVRACLAGLLLVPAAHADTVTLRNYVGYNGKIVSLDKTGLKLRMRGLKGVDTDLAIPRAEVVRFEFNGNLVNQGPPPQLGAREGKGGPTPVPKQDNDSIVFRGSGQKKTCPGIVVEGNTVKCGDKTYSREDVWRVFLTQP